MTGVLNWMGYRLFRKDAGNLMMWGCHQQVTKQLRSNCGKQSICCRARLRDLKKWTDMNIWDGKNLQLHYAL